MISFFFDLIRKNVNSSLGSNTSTNDDAFDAIWERCAACVLDCSSERDDCTIAPVGYIKNDWWGTD